MNPHVTAFFDSDTSTVTYVVREPEGPHCAIVDSVLGFDPRSGRTNTDSADSVIAHVRSENLIVDWLLETHAHADHLSAAPYLQSALGGAIAIGEHIADVQAIFSKIFNTEAGFAVDGSQFDRLFADGDAFSIGSLAVRVMHTPGHTPACLTYVAGDAAFVGDTMFMPDYGTARADFPGGDAATLFRSIQKILALPAQTRVFVCHDYLPKGRDEHAWEASVRAQRENVHLAPDVGEDDYVEMRTTRDRTLSMPKLILQSIQVNMRAGHLPPEEDNGVSYLKIPIDVL